MGFEIKEDGFVPVTIAGTTVELDLYRVWHEVNKIHQDAKLQFPDSPGAAEAHALTGLQKFLGELGFGAVSMRVAERFDDAVWEAVDGLKKADGTGPTPA